MGLFRTDVCNPRRVASMTDLLTWSINLGRWSGVQVRVHYFLIFFAVSRLVNALFSMGEGPRVVPTACWLLVLLVVLVLHELGHAAMAAIGETEAEDVRLWPLGNLVVATGPKSSDTIAVAAAGLVTSGLLAVGTLVLLNLYGASMVLNPFGWAGGKAGEVIDAGAPVLVSTGKQVAALRPLWWAGWFGYLNWVVFLANLIPALPMDGGRIVRAILARSSVGITRDNPYAQWLAHSFAGILTLVGLVKMFSSFPDGLTLFSLALLIELIVRSEARMMEDGGFFEDGVFGYDFSEGYTSLEAGAAKVRPYRESALKRWRRRRSELRRRRRVAREAAEEQRMDEILEKLHTQGKAALTEEEHRFLVRASTKLRNNRPRP